MTKCIGCGLEVDETKMPQALADWEQITVSTTRAGGSLVLLTGMVCPKDAPANGDAVSLSVKVAKAK